MAHGRSTDTAQAEQPGRLSVTATTTDGIHVLTVAGEIDHHTGDQLRQALDITGTTRPHVVIDMSRVTFMDSSGLASLLNAQRRLTRAGRKLSLIVSEGPVARILQTTRLDTTFALADTPTQALDLP